MLSLQKRAGSRHSQRSYGVVNRLLLFCREILLSSQPSKAAYFVETPGPGLALICFLAGQRMG